MHIPPLCKLPQSIVTYSYSFISTVSSSASPNNNKTPILCYSVSGLIRFHFHPNSYEKQHKMTTREADEDRVQAKQEENHENRSTAKAAIAPGSSWSRLKDPRIVRVSRAFGGKDRHSKVCTVRGLRDRRVRLSVPTAIQLYDLQDRLGLNQPSKVVDWQLNIAKNEIDELPPLPNIPPPGSFGHNLGQPIVAPHHQSNSELASLLDQTEPSGSNNVWLPDALFRPKPSKEAVDSSEEKESWTRNENSYFSSNNFFSRLDHHSSSSSSSGLGLMNTSTMPYNSLIRWDPSNLSLSQSGSPGMAAEDFHNFGLVPLPPSVPTLPTGSQQVLHVYHQPGGDHVTQPYFPSHIAAASDYSAGGGRQFHLLGTATKLHPSQNDHQEKQDGENGFHLR